MSWLFWCVVVLLVLGIILRERIMEIVFGVLDLYYHHEFVKIYSKGFFSGGWGDGEIIDKLVDYLTKKCPKYAEEISVEWIEDNIDEKSGGRIRLGKFLSPLGEYLPEGSEHAHFLFLEPKKKSDKLLIIPPAGGQMGFGWRIKNIARPMMKKGFAVVLTVHPNGKHRVPKKNNGKIRHDLDFVHEWVVQCSAQIQELRSLTRYYIESEEVKGFKTICLTGLSWGAIMSTQTVRWPISPDMSSKVVCVPCMANDFSGSKVYARNSKKMQQLPSCPWKSLLRSGGDETKLKGIEEYFRVIYELLDFAPVELGHTKSNLQEVIILVATQDVFHDSDDTERTKKLFSKVLLANSEGEDDEVLTKKLEVRFMRCGHFTPFVFQSVRKKYFFKAIQDIFQKDQGKKMM